MKPPYELVPGVSRAASAENPSALPGSGGKANAGRKGRPCISPFPIGTTINLLETEGPGVVRHIWMTVSGMKPTLLRNLILRVWWDGQTTPSVECPVGDFFGVSHGLNVPMDGTPVSMQGGRGFNCWIPMPFRERALITLSNESEEEVAMLFYQVDFTLGDELPSACGYFHAQFRRANPCPLQQDYVILDHVEQPGVYLGTVIGVRSLFQEAWWGEGEMKFFLDDDAEYPTICGTGLEDYMGSAWGLDRVVTPRQGAPVVYNVAGYYSVYRFHFDDPIRFKKLQRVTVQQIGCGDRATAQKHFGESLIVHPAAGVKTDGPVIYMERSDDWSSVAYWYQELPTAPFPPFPSRAIRQADLPSGEEMKRQDI